MIGIINGFCNLEYNPGKYCSIRFRDDTYSTKQAHGRPFGYAEGTKLHREINTLEGGAGAPEQGFEASRIGNARIGCSSVGNSALLSDCTMVTTISDLFSIRTLESKFGIPSELPLGRVQGCDRLQKPDQLFRRLDISSTADRGKTN
ncbi:uncharacterized protein LOC129747822 [Uranotaenia lowii]|uniref:uncharacterized protein LOC129747822 n=1 Tax=Uranotaenia lowii TaxID=190385 RepID=UPI0024795B99|nr:uncharacterized protein LOC129747822 [Uranotaenia lowii]XP_055598158.1 uncharacterized protein LOC129747822 [Uranotaenia lowii]